MVRAFISLLTVGRHGFGQWRRRTAFVLVSAAMPVLMSCGTWSVLVREQVWAEWVPPLWYRGKIEGRCERGLRVRFEQQDEKCNSMEQMAEDFAPRREDVKVGAQVLVPGEEASERLEARVKEIRAQTYRVRLSDGSEQEHILKDLRLVR